MRKWDARGWHTVLSINTSQDLSILVSHPSCSFLASIRTFTGYIHHRKVDSSQHAMFSKSHLVWINELDFLTVEDITP